MTTPIVNPWADSFHQDPYPAYALLRSEAPVYEVPDQPGLFFVTTWSLVREALLDPQVYSNHMPAARRVEPPAEIVDIRSQGYEYVPTLNNNDAPVHTRFRRLVNRAFTPRALAWMEPLVDGVADQLAEDLVDGETVDVMERVTVPLPVWAIMRILGLEESRRTDIRLWSEAAIISFGGIPSKDAWVAAEQHMLRFQQVMADELDERRLQPREDLLSVLANSEDDDGAPASNSELVWLVRELMVAGNETTTRALADIILRLDEIPDAWDRLLEDVGYRRAVVEEGIRLASPAMGLWRRVTRATELGGTPLPAGSSLFLAFGSANRDDDVFSNADAFDPLRENIREHLAFGHGIHACVGAGLARIETESALRALAQRVTSLEVIDRTALKYAPSYALRGLTELPVRIHRR